MVEYDQALDSSHKIFYNLFENTPSPSNSTHAAFRVELGLYLLTSLAKVKYLACPTSILSSDFNIIVSQIYPGTISANNNYFYTLSSPLSTASTYTWPLWMSGI